MDVPYDIRHGYDLLDQHLLGDAEAHFCKFLEDESYSNEDQLRARALTGLALVARRHNDYRRVLEQAIASVKASGPKLNNSWALLQEAARRIYSDDQLTHGKCNICQSDLVCPSELDPADMCCPYHEGVNIQWRS